MPMRRRLAAKQLQYRSTHPLVHGALATKDGIRAFVPPDSEIRTTLATTYWLEKTIADLPQSHPSLLHLEERLRSESATPPSASNRSFISVVEQRKPISFFDLPQEVRNVIYEYSVGESAPMSPVVRDTDKHSLAANLCVAKSQYLRTGLPVLGEVFTTLQKETAAMLPKFYRANTFQFDLRIDGGSDALRRWIQEKQDEASLARKISIKHWTWWFKAPGGWEHVADETILSLMPCGLIKLVRNRGQLDPEICDCEMEDFVSTQCPGWKINQPWSVADFVKALREEDELLIQAVNKFVELLHYHDNILHIWRDGPRPCPTCGKPMIFVRSEEDGGQMSD